MATSTYTDTELGTITVKRLPGTKHIRVRVTVNGSYSVTAPTYAPLFAIKAFVASVRPKLVAMATKSAAPIYADGQKIGQSHRITVINTGMVTAPKAFVKGTAVAVQLPHGMPIESTIVQVELKKAVKNALKTEAKAYLPQRLKQLALQHDFYYERVRLSHAGTRWGSCSTTGTISLNIGLMKLPPNLIDYVLIHELCHTRHMDHSDAFWQLVAAYDPNYQLHRRQAKRFSPNI